MKITILDGYIDEPSRLGVPPFISPYARYAAGAIKSSGHEFEYVTIDEWRNGRKPASDLIFIMNNPDVPGKYLRGMPASEREIDSIRQNYAERTLVWRCGEGDPDAMIFDCLDAGDFKTRKRTMKEWREWSILGSSVVTLHPDHPQPMIAEIDMSVGCPRFITGGCSFCSEIAFGKPVFRPQKDILDELKALLSNGVRNFRLGGQSCIFSYMSGEIGVSDTPKPNVDALFSLFDEIKKLDGVEILHTDNANPAVIAEHPDECKKILEKLVEVCTSGNVLSLGLESADPAVKEANNLNASAEQTRTAVRMINEAGRERGENGMPELLPGLNFIAGLDGENKATYDINFGFLKSILDEGQLLRRINIRQVRNTRRVFGHSKYKKDFIRFKEKVREEIDRPLLERVVPAGTVLKDVYLELKKGKTTFGRQVGTYPILVGLAYAAEIERFADVMITSHGRRSITGVEYPIKINEAGMDMITALPGIGKKRAARIVRQRPFRSFDELAASLDDPAVVEQLRDHIVFR